MARLKILMCDCCDKKIIQPKKTTWRHISKIAKRFGWLIGEFHLCDDCRKRLEIELAKENEHDGE